MRSIHRISALALMGAATISIAQPIATPGGGGAAPTARPTAYGTTGAEIELVFELRSGERLNDVHVRIEDLNGAPWIETVTKSGSLVVRLPRGRYIVRATFASHTITKPVSLDGARLVIEGFQWGQQPIGALGTPQGA